MIVEGVLLAGVVYKLFVAPIKSVVLGAKLAESHLDRPGVIVVQDEDGNKVAFPSTDFYASGKQHTDYLEGWVVTESGETKNVVLSYAEVELMQFDSFIEAQLEKGKPVPETVLRLLCQAIRRRRDEATRSPSRQVTRTPSKRRKAA